MAAAGNGDAIIVMDNLAAQGSAGYDMTPLGADFTEDDDGSRMTITVRQGQTSFEVALSPDSLVEELRVSISSLTNSPPFSQRLVYQGKELKEDHRSLSSYGIHDGSAIFLIVSTSAAPSPEPQPASAGSTVATNSTARSTRYLPSGSNGAGVVSGNQGVQYVMVLPVTGEQMIVLPPDEEVAAREMSDMSKRNSMIVFFACLVTMTETIIYWSVLTLLLINIPRLCLMYVGYQGARYYRKPNVFIFILYLGMEGVFFLVTFFRAVGRGWVLWAITYAVIDILIIAWLVYNVRFYRLLSTSREIIVARARQITANSAALF